MRMILAVVLLACSFCVQRTRSFSALPQQPQHNNKRRPLPPLYDAVSSSKEPVSSVVWLEQEETLEQQHGDIGIDKVEDDKDDDDDDDMLLQQQLEEDGGVVVVAEKQKEPVVVLESEDELGHNNNDSKNDKALLYNLDGHVLTPAYFCQHMHLDPESVTSYSTENAFSGFMSRAQRVTLLPEQQTVFSKRVVFDELAHSHTKDYTKLVRDIRSYEVVAAVLQSKACRRFAQACPSVVIPKLHHSEQRPCHAQPMRSQFTFLLEDLNPKDGWYQKWLLDDATHTHAALDVYAHLHAYFWQGSDFYADENAVQELEDSVWPCGSYVQPVMQGWDQCEKVAKKWPERQCQFQRYVLQQPQDCPALYDDTLGQRLQRVAKACGRLAHPLANAHDMFASSNDELAQSYYKYRTLTHGDPKQANLLFRRRRCKKDETKNEPELQVGLLDFQWCGFGLAATDVAHFVTSAVHADLLEGHGEQRLVRYYYDTLQRHWDDYHVPKENRMPWPVFWDHYEIALLDICRLAIAYTFARFTEAVEGSDEEACARTMNRTSYNKSVANVIWLLNRCHEILKQPPSLLQQQQQQGVVDEGNDDNKDKDITVRKRRSQNLAP